MDKRKKPKLTIFLTVGLLLYFSWILVDQQRLIFAMNNEKKILETKIEEEKKVNEELKRQKEMVNSDEFVEKMAREKLGMVKKGERIFIDSNR